MPSASSNIQGMAFRGPTPVDLKDAEGRDFRFDAVKLDDALGELEPVWRTLPVFDACRNELKLPGRTIAKGLEPVAQRNGEAFEHPSK